MRVEFLNPRRYHRRMSLPMIKTLNKRRFLSKPIKPIAPDAPGRKSLADRSMAQAWEDGIDQRGAIDVFVFAPEELLGFLKVRMFVARQAMQRSKGVLGRLYNSVSGGDPDYVDFTGVHLKQTLAVAEIAIPDGIQDKDGYKLRVDVVERAIEKLEEQPS